MEKKALLIVKHPPYGTNCGICIYEAKRAAVGLSGEDMETSILLVDDGVYFLLKNHNPSALGMQSLELALQDLDEFDIQLLAHKPSLEERGISEEEIREVKLLGDNEIRELVHSSDVIITF